MISGYPKDDMHSTESAGKPLTSLDPMGCAASRKASGCLCDSRFGRIGRRSKPDYSTSIGLCLI